MAEPTADIAADLSALRNDVARLTNSLSDVARQQASTTSDRVLATIDDARAQLSSKASDAQEWLEASAADVQAKIERNPMTAVLVALTAGLLIGMMGSNRR